MKKYIALLSFVLFFATMSLAQPNMTLYQMHDIVQSNSLNPAVPISCGWVVSFPGMGGVALGASTPLSYNDFGAGENALDVDKFISKLHNKNVFTTSANINLITIGYRAERTFYQFTINERASQVSSVYQDPIVMLLKGNSSYVGKTVDGAPSVNALHYREYGFNVAHEINSTLWIGARAKLLFGRLSLRSVNNSVAFYTDAGTYNLDLTSDALIQASMPGHVTIDPVTNKVSNVETNFKASDFIFNPSNIGAGIDLGAVKSFDNGVQLSASLLNIGFINWSKNLHTFRQKGTISFNGPFSPINEWGALRDTLRSFAKLDYAQESYSQMLAPTIMAGINYPLNENIRIGVTGMTEIQPNNLPWALTATGFTQGLPIVDLGLSYTVTPYSLFNVGFGLGARLGPVNLHFLADNVIGLFQPFNARYATIQFGINFRFGCGNGGESSKSSKSSSHDIIPCPAFKSVLKGSNYKAVPCSTRANSSKKK